MIQRQLDSHGDWTFGKGKGNYLRGEDAINLNLKTRILSFWRNCFFDKDAGIDYINYILNKNNEGLEQEIRRVVLATDGITAINSLNLSVDPNARKAIWTIDFKTVYSKSNIISGGTNA
jgi:hypothetical protein